MAITDSSYYINDVNIPLSTDDDLNKQFLSAVERYENEVLKKLLGYTLWKEYVVGIAEETPDKKWTDLRDGAEFTFEVDGHTVKEKWNGLLNDDKVSILSYYVYFMMRKNNETYFTGTGEVASDNENAVMADFKYKMVNVNNLMVELYGEIPKNIIRHCNFMDNINYIHFNHEPSAYNFLLANLEDYPNWIFKPIGKMNTVGI